MATKQHRSDRSHGDTRNLGNTDQNPVTTIDEIEAAAKKAGLLTTSMLAKEMGVTEGTIRNRINRLGVKPSARIFPKGRGRFTWAYRPEVLEEIGEMVGEIRVETL